MADAKAEDIQELLGGALFKALYKWMVESGPVYLLPTGTHTAVIAHPTVYHLVIQILCTSIHWRSADRRPPPFMCRSGLKLPGGI